MSVWQIFEDINEQNLACQVAKKVGGVAFGIGAEQTEIPMVSLGDYIFIVSELYLDVYFDQDYLGQKQVQHFIHTCNSIKKIALMNRNKAQEYLNEKK